jgi:hypothetical protein
MKIKKKKKRKIKRRERRKRRGLCNIFFQAVFRNTKTTCKK